MTKFLIVGSPCALAAVSIAFAAAVFIKWNNESEALQQIEAIGGNAMYTGRYSLIPDFLWQACPPLSTVKSVDISDQSFSKADLKALLEFPQLRKLDVQKTAFDDDDLHLISGISSLKQVVMTNTNITREGLDKFQDERPDVTTWPE